MRCNTATGGGVGGGVCGGIGVAVVVFVVVVMLLLVVVVLLVLVVVLVVVVVLVWRWMPRAEAAAVKANTCVFPPCDVSCANVNILVRVLVVLVTARVVLCCGLG